MRILFRYSLMAALLLSIAVGSSHADEVTTAESKFPGMSWGPLAKATLADLPEGTLAEAKDLKVTEVDLNAEVADAPQSIREQLKKYSFFALEQMLTRKLLHIEATAWGKNNNVNKEPDETLSLYLASVTSKVTVTEAEIEKFRKDNAGLLKDMTPEEQKSEVRKFLEDQQRHQILDKYIRSVGGRHAIQLSEAWASAEYKKWLTNPVEVARKSGMPSLVDFNAEWCAPCKQMAPIIQGFREQYKEKLNVVLVDTDQEPILAAHYGANSIPLLLLYDRDGKEVFRHNGTLPKADIQEKLSKLGL